MYSLISVLLEGRSRPNQETHPSSQTDYYFFFFFLVEPANNESDDDDVGPPLPPGFMLKSVDAKSVDDSDGMAGVNPTPGFSQTGLTETSTTNSIETDESGNKLFRNTEDDENDDEADEDMEEDDEVSFVSYKKMLN